ncbi:MAG: FAD-dependent oxidoreductase [Cytophagaceae bacterium]|nr:FAD-dependent oxidoreductase [Cytophagaceae bacterium]|tara:strand:- start:12370 stop:13488 length:1119 start_codon:yes stop_codon:yes gene_type:complete
MGQSFSYWELKTWFTDVDLAIVGSGITGLSCAIELRKKHPKAKILILEKGILPNGASTKNAGFACFGSPSEIIEDLKSHSMDEVLGLVEKRFKGLEILRQRLGDNTIKYEKNGGYELFLAQDKDLYTKCSERLPELNKMLHVLFKEDTFEAVDNLFGLKRLMPRLLLNKFEGQIDTGAMMHALLAYAQKQDILILNGQQVLDFEDQGNRVVIKTGDFELQSRQLFIATNGFAERLKIKHVKPARAQVLITKPIKNLHIKGTFHLDRGYYYFRNVDDRILLGGGRNLDIAGETTMTMGTTPLIQHRLRQLLQEVILPGVDFEIAHCWSGIMGVGKQKKPIVGRLSPNVAYGVRLGGMGVAMGSLVGRELAEGL